MLQRFIFLFIVVQISFSQNAEKLLEKGKNLYEEMDYSNALKNLDKAIKLDDKLVDAFFYRGLTNTRLKNFNNAINDYSSALNINSEDELAYFNRGLINYALKNNDKALADFTSAILIDSKFTEAYKSLALLKIRLRDLEGAIDTYSQIISFDPINSYAYYNRGLLKYRTGKKPEACIDARIALTHNSSNNLSGAINMLIENSCEKTPSTSKPLVIKGESNKSSINFNIVDEVPIWPGCYGLQSEMRGCFQRNIQAHIARNFRYPKMAQDRKIQGRVFVQFTIDIDGTISQIRTRGPHPLLEQEGRRIISLIPRIQPGMQNGKPVRVPFSIPITFKLQ